MLKRFICSDYCLETPELNMISVKDTSFLTGCLLHVLLAREFHVRKLQTSSQKRPALLFKYQLFRA